METSLKSQVVDRQPHAIRVVSLKWLLIGIVFAYVGVLILAPIAALITGAAAEGLGAVVAALSAPDVLLAFWLTLLISIIIVVVHAVFGTLVAWMMVRHSFPGIRVINALLDLPFAVSPVVVGYVLLLLFGRGGLLEPLISSLGIKVAFALPGMILATLFVTLPFMIRELIPVLQAFDIEQERAAMTLGANNWHIFWRITFPALRWGLIYGLILTFTRALGEFGAVLVVGGGIQGRTETVTVAIYRMLDERQYVGAYSAALVLGLVSFVLVLGTELLRRKDAE